MKAKYTELYPNEKYMTNIGNYSEKHSTSLPQHITDYYDWALETYGEESNYMISPLQAQFQIWMAKALGAKRILEVGCFIGFSAMTWAHAVGPDGQVTTLEFDPGFAKTAEHSLAKNQIKNVEVIIGDAQETMKSLATTIKEPYDLIFIDADKPSYPTYLSLILSSSYPTVNSTRLLRPGGIIIADNTLRYGLVADSSNTNPWTSAIKEMEDMTWMEGDVEGLTQFNAMMVEDSRLETFLMPLFDGLGMAKLKE